MRCCVLAVWVEANPTEDLDAFVRGFRFSAFVLTNGSFLLGPCSQASSIDIFLEGLQG